MVENAEDVTRETKPNFVEFSRDVKPPKVEAKPNIDGASVHVEASKYVGSGVLPLQAHEVDTTNLKSKRVCGSWHFLKPPRKVPTKGAKKKVDIARSKGKITSTSRIPSSWEVVDSQNPDSQPSPSPTTSSYKRKKGARLGKTLLNPFPPPTRYPKPKVIPVMRPIDYMPRFMFSFIAKVVDVIGDGHCGFRAIAEFMGLTEKNHLMIRTHLIQELKDHGDDYVEVFAGEDRYNYILNGLHPPANTKSCAHLVDKWLTFLDMGHIIANYYKRSVVVLTNLEAENS
ncbi:OTU-like cysteine protease [Medicago truncatula]|uniref:OTU-like cysteine protease n=1 Tax=Medicago truncatula TaxID=3880 RepID=A0A072U9R5_MEDTR|nr:OTU-like cysteine protease [Medicago truncatula]